MRRDFRSVLRLIQTHALIHQLSRPRDPSGAVVATEADYLSVRGLVADLISDGVGATVPETIRETVEVVRHLLEEDDAGVTVRAVAAKLDLDRSATSRRLQAARERGYLVSQETRRGRPARYAIGDPMPDEMDLLPHTCTPPDSEPAGQDRVCSSAAAREEEEPGWMRIQREAGEKPETDEEAAYERARRYLEPLGRKVRR
jgi:IclR-like helix-turn-helix domain-containing protein